MVGVLLESVVCVVVGGVNEGAWLAAVDMAGGLVTMETWVEGVAAGTEIAVVIGT